MNTQPSIYHRYENILEFCINAILQTQSLEILNDENGYGKKNTTI